jgi:hypothetical protein
MGWASMRAGYRSGEGIVFIGRDVRRGGCATLVLEAAKQIESKKESCRSVWVLGRSGKFAKVRFAKA